MKQLIILFLSICFIQSLNALDNDREAYIHKAEVEISKTDHVIKFLEVEHNIEKANMLRRLNNHLKELVDELKKATDSIAIGSLKYQINGEVSVIHYQINQLHLGTTPSSA